MAIKNNTLIWNSHSLSLMAFILLSIGPTFAAADESELKTAQEALIGETLVAGFKSEIVRIVEEATGGSFLNDYSAGTKHLVGFGFDIPKPIGPGIKVQLLIDMDDFLGSTPEGADGWITYWLDVKTRFSLPIYNDDLGTGLYVVGARRELNVDDPLRRLQFTALSGNFGAIEIRSGNVGYDGSNLFEIDVAPANPNVINGEFLTTGGTLIRGEIKLGELDLALGEALSNQSGGVSWTRLAQNLVFLLFHPPIGYSYFPGIVSPAEHRPFTSSDDPPAPDSGNPRARKIQTIRGGLDSDGDGYPNNYIPPSGTGSTPSVLYDLDAYFFSSNTLQEDYRLDVGSLPSGWRVVAKGSEGQQLDDHYYVFNGVPNTRYGTEWYVGCTPSAQKIVTIDFKLLAPNLIFPDEMLDTATVAFNCESPPVSSGDYILTISKVGSSPSGMVTSAPSVVSCNSDCDESSVELPPGTMITLTATSDPGTVFSGWGGDCSGTGQCVLSMNADMLVTASFNPDTVATVSPVSPTSLTASALSTTQIQLDWNDNSGNEDGFKIERRRGAGTAWFQIKTLGPNIQTFTNGSLLPNTEYDFRVYSYNEAGSSQYSNISSARTDSNAPNAPSPLTGWALTSSKIALSWNDTNVGAASHEIEQSSDGSAWSTVGFTGTGDTTFTRSVSQNSTRHFRVRAHHSASGYSAYSNEIEVTACAPPDDPRLDNPYSGEKNAPVDQVLEWRGDDEVDTWDLYLGTTNPPPLFAQDILNSSPGDNVAFDPGDLVEGQQFFWQVVAHADCNNSLSSDSSLHSFFTIGAPDPVTLILPENEATNVPLTTLIDWENVQNQGSWRYKLYLDDSISPTLFEDVETRTWRLTDSSATLPFPLAPTTSYCWFVEAYAAEDPDLSSTSETRCFTTGSSVSSNIEVDVSQDAGLRAGASAGTNFSGSGVPDRFMAAGTSRETEDGLYSHFTDDAQVASALQFSLTGVPEGSTIQSAILTLPYCCSYGSVTTPADLFLDPFTSSWTEGSINWSNRPSTNDSHRVTGTFPTSGFNPTNVDLTPLVEKWFSETISNFGFLVQMPSAIGGMKVFLQKEDSGDDPSLSIIYAEPCTATAPPTLISPVDSASELGPTISFDWDDVAGSAGYKLFLGETNPPAYHSDMATSSFEVELDIANQTYFWQVQSIASCASSEIASSVVNYFETGCIPVAAPSLDSPLNLATGISSSVSLNWSSVPGAGSYTVYFGTNYPPTEAVVQTTDTSFDVNVEGGGRYYWYIEAAPDCDNSLTSASPIFYFDSADAPVADAGPSVHLLEGNSTLLGGSPTASGGLAPYTYSWSFEPPVGVTFSSTSIPNPEVTVVSAGNYTVQVIVVDSKGFASSPATASMTAEPPPDEIFANGFE